MTPTGKSSSRHETGEIESGNAKHLFCELTESMAKHPGSAVSGLYFSHPDVHYFGISVLAKDQVGDYSKRKAQTIEEAENWLGPWLGY